MIPATIAEGSIPPGFAAPTSGACRWLVSLDYDGTLQQSSSSPISAEFFEQMQVWRAHGVRWGINTGRSLNYLLQEILPCSPVLPDFICTCERYVYQAGTDGRLHPAIEHNELCHRHNAELRAFLSPRLHSLLAELRRTHPQLQWEPAADDPLSIEAHDSPTMDAIIPHLLPLVSEGHTIQRAGRYMRFADARYTKGTALELVRQTWQVAEGNMFIMGDGQNDLDAFRMFPAAWCAVPAGAHAEVLDWLEQHPEVHLAPENDVLPELRRWFRMRVEA